MEHPYDTALKLLVALAIGLLIGIERGWSGRGETEGSRVAGIRTFSLIGLLGSVLALLSGEVEWILPIGFVSVSALIIAAHMLDVRKSKDVGATTAFAMMLTFALAAWATLDHPIPAVVVTVIVMSLLGYKPLLHTWLARIKPQDFYSGVKLLIISLVLLPLLPNQGYGPWDALNPYWIWWMVVLISGLSFLGYLAMELIGERMGTLVTAIAGALVSSTAVTVSLARFARQHAHATMFAGGVILASAIMFVRVVIEVLVVHPGLLHPLWIPLGAMLAGLLCGVVWLWLRHGRDTEGSRQGIEVKNPLQLGMALQFSLLLAVVLLLSEAMQEWFGHQGVYALAVASGLMDVDAITLSLARSATQDLPGEVAAMGIVLACATNTLVKGVLFAFIAGVKRNMRIPLFLAAAMLPGLLLAFLVL